MALTRIAVVGTGPSALYTCKYILDSNNNKNLLIDLFESLPVPFGLVRYGIAPDHPEVKAVSSQFTELITKNNESVRFFGNVNIGTDVSIERLRTAYSAVIIASGAQTEAGKLNISGENLSGVLSSHHFVNWYNGHPNHCNLTPVLRLDQVENVVIVGNGNVSLDCARILSKQKEDLETTDISVEALEALSSSNVKSVTIIGRRGPVQASFTIKELRELSSLSNINFRINQSDIVTGMNVATKNELEGNRPKTRILELLNKLSSTSSGNHDNNSNNKSKTRSVDLAFLKSPVEVIPQPSSPNCIGAVRLELNRLEGETFKQKAVGTGVYETIPCQLLLKAVGYRSLPIDGVPFDFKTYSFPHIRGRIFQKVTADSLRSEPSSSSAVNTIGLYVTGWAKRGPVGIIGSNISDAKETAESVLEDIKSGVLKVSHRDSKAFSQFGSKSATNHDIGAYTASGVSGDPIEVLTELQALVNNGRVVTWEEFLKIDTEEVRRGAACSPKKPRVKILSVQEMLQVAKGVTAK